VFENAARYLNAETNFLCRSSAVEKIELAERCYSSLHLTLTTVKATVNSVVKSGVNFGLNRFRPELMPELTPNLLGTTLAVGRLWVAGDIKQ